MLVKFLEKNKSPLVGNPRRVESVRFPIVPLYMEPNTTFTLENVTDHESALLFWEFLLEKLRLSSDETTKFCSLPGEYQGNIYSESGAQRVSFQVSLFAPSEIKHEAPIEHDFPDGVLRSVSTLYHSRSSFCVEFRKICGDSMLFYTWLRQRKQEMADRKYVSIDQTKVPRSLPCFPSLEGDKKDHQDSLKETIAVLISMESVRHRDCIAERLECLPTYALEKVWSDIEAPLAEWMTHTDFSLGKIEENIFRCCAIILRCTSEKDPQIVSKFLRENPKILDLSEKVTEKRTWEEIEKCVKNCVKYETHLNHGQT